MTRSSWKRQAAGNEKDFYNVLAKSVPSKRTIITGLPEGTGSVGVEQEIKVRKTVIAWGLPLDETLFSKWFVNYLSLPVMPWDVQLTASSTYLPDARNIIHKNFLEGTKAEWLLMLDSDVCPPANVVEKLLSHHKQMVGGWYRKKNLDAWPVVYSFSHVGENGKGQWKQYTQPGQGLEKVDGAGAGCWLMHRSVAEALGPEPYDLIHGGEDLDMCRKVTEAGFDLYVDWDIYCGHVGTAFV